MRHSSARAALVAFSLVVPAAAGAGLVACSAVSAGDDGGADAAEASTYEAGGHDATSDGTTSDAPADTTPTDASTGDGGADGAAHGDAGDAGPGDAGAADGCAVGASGEYLDLSCAHLYADWSTKAVYSDVKAYDPGLHLWSDGAIKSRWINLPAGQKIDSSNMDEWTFPIGTQVWKEFSLPLADGGAPVRIETRLLWKQGNNDWYRTTYRWSADGTSKATELTGGELDAGGVGYEVPTQDECNSCHNGRLDGVLGFEALALSSPGATGLNMQALTAQGLLTNTPPQPLVVPGNATEQAALSFLHANCGTACHNPNGGASFTGFFMRLDVGTLSSVQATSAYITGWNQPTFGFQIPDAATTYRLHACDVPSSCAYYRASRREGVDGTQPGVQMPPIDSHKVDDADIAVLAAWINEGCDAGAPDAGGD